MVTDAVCGFGVAAHVSRLLRLVFQKTNLPTMEVTMRMNFDGVWEFVAQRVPRRVSEHAQAIRTKHCRKPCQVCHKGSANPPTRSIH